jgi:hypothetical protein
MKNSTIEETAADETNTLWEIRSAYNMYVRQNAMHKAWAALS